MDNTEADTAKAEPEKEERALIAARAIWRDILADYRAYQAAEEAENDGEELKDAEGKALDPEEEKDRIRDEIVGDSYGIMLRSDWFGLGEDAGPPGEFTITLGGGGPSHRVHGQLDNGDPFDVELQYQDWFTPWETFFPEVDELDEYRTVMGWYAGFFNFQT